MTFPAPVPGLVIRNSYLWKSEHDRGREEGVKDRPCAIVLAIKHNGDAIMVTVVPITHAPPSDLELAIELPPETKRRIGLDDESSWVVLNEANRFLWPGPDLRPLKAGDVGSVAYGQLPYALFERIRLRFVAALKKQRAHPVQRTE